MRQKRCEVCLERPAAETFVTEDGTRVDLCKSDYRSAMKNGLFWVNVPTLKALLEERGEDEG